MSDYYYSFKEKGFFYKPDTESGDCPTDLIPLTDEHYHELMQGQVDGKYIEHRKGGQYWLNIANIRLKNWLHRLNPEKRNSLPEQSQSLRHWHGQ